MLLNMYRTFALSMVIAFSDVGSAINLKQEQGCEGALSPPDVFTQCENRFDQMETYMD